MIFFLILAISGGAYYYSFIHNLEGKIYPATYVDNIDMGYKTKDEALGLLAKRDDYLNAAFIEVLYKKQPIATFSAEQLQIHRDVKTKVDQAYIVGRTPHLPSMFAQQINAMIKAKRIDFYTALAYDKAPIESFIKGAEQTYNRPPKNALFKFENGRVTSFKAHENGKQLLSKNFLDQMYGSIQNISTKKTHIQVPLEEKVIEPEITLAKSNTHGIEELIGEGQSNYSHSIPTRIHNVILASSKFNGVIIPKGDTFSFNALIGDISSNSGYQPAYIIQNGRTVLGDGGGVCQVSTTLFRAAMNTGLPIEERHAHAYRVGYYENDSQPGFDATIFTPSVDLKFKNDTNAAILIMTEVEEDNMILRFKFYGKKDNRKVELSPVTVWDVAPPPEALYQDDPTLPSGFVKQVDYPAWGGKSKFTYKVTNGSNVYEKEFYSVYRPWQAVFLRGTGPT